MIRPLIFGVIVLAALTAALPPVRERASPVVVPVWNLVRPIFEEPLMRRLEPVRHWVAERELEQLLRALLQHDAATRPIPEPEAFPSFVRAQNLSPGRGALDPWGEEYVLQLIGDSIVVVSPGPDRRVGTADDLRKVAARR